MLRANAATKDMEARALRIVVFIFNPFSNQIRLYLLNIYSVIVLKSMQLMFEVRHIFNLKSVKKVTYHPIQTIFLKP